MSNFYEMVILKCQLKTIEIQNNSKTYNTNCIFNLKYSLCRNEGKNELL